MDSIKKVSLALYQNNEVDALLARIERIYQEVDEETQDYLMRLHSEFTKDMETLINNIQKKETSYKSSFTNLESNRRKSKCRFFRYL